MSRRLSLFAVALLLGGCAAPLAQQGFGEIAERTAASIGSRPHWLLTSEDEAAQRQRLDELLAAPLGIDSAVQIALLNNRHLQQAYAELGIGAADLVAARRPENPGIGLGRFRRGQDIEIERSLGFNLLGLLALPVTAGIEERRFEQTKLRLAAESLALAAKVKQAWYDAVAAAQLAQHAEQVTEAAATQAELARRMRAAGNWSLLDYSREQLFHGEAAARLAKTRLAAERSREKLARLLGLWGADMAFRLPERLPALPAVPRQIDNIEAATIAGRLDIQMAQAELAALRQAHGLTNATRFINLLETGLVRNSESGRKDKTGYELRLEVPLFDFGDARATRAEHLYRQGLQHLAAIAVDARSAARESYLGYRTSFDLARHHQQNLLPLRQKISEEMLVRYNGMLVSVFDLLADAREQILATEAALEAQRDFWRADTELSFVTLIALQD